MAFVTPPDFASGATLTAAQLDILGDDLLYLKGISDGLTFSAARVTRSAATSIPDATWSTITFSAEVFDYGSWWSSGTNIVVPADAIPAGYTSIAIDARISTLFAANATGYRAIRLLVNGSEEFNATQGSFATDQARVIASDFAVVVAGDIITVQVYQNSTGALDASFTKVTVARYMPVA